MTDDATPTLDDVLGILSAKDRRRALYYLREHDRATRPELADVLTGWLAADRADGTADKTDRERVVSELHHRHLPALRDSELVTVADETGTVEATDWPRWVERCLDIAFNVEADGAAEPDRPVGRTVDERDR